MAGKNIGDKGSSRLPSDKHPPHRGSPVKVGRFTIYAAGTRYLKPQDCEKVDIVVPLQSEIIASLGRRVDVLACPWPDMSPPPEGFKDFLHESVIPLLEAGKRIMVYCIGSHGRTGTFIASLIAILEHSGITPDPIAAARERHCIKAVETFEQADYVFALRGEHLPDQYLAEFLPSIPKASPQGWGVPARVYLGEEGWLQTRALGRPFQVGSVVDAQEDLGGRDAEDQGQDEEGEGRGD